MTLADGECLAVYSVGGGLRGFSEEFGDNEFSIATRSGDFQFVSLYGVPIGRPIVTAVRLWLWEAPGVRYNWDDRLSYLCWWCGERFAADGRLLDVIYAIYRDTGIEPNQSPCLELPREAWDEPKLLSECPECGGKLKFNPFIVDNRDLY
jgi:DNA-directed RNA polymerase subunit RPC12/RpoP